jgi:acyl carrier protein
MQKKMKTKKLLSGMNGITVAKKLNKVFKSYGILLNGKQRNLHLKNDLHMDEIFIKGLIFELEFVSKKYLDKDFAEFELRPANLIEEFIS